MLISLQIVIMCNVKINIRSLDTCVNRMKHVVNKSRCMEEDPGYMLRDGGCTSTHYSVMRCQGTEEGSTKVVRRIMA